MPKFSTLFLILRSKQIDPVIEMINSDPEIIVSEFERIVSAAGLIIAEIGLINPAALKAAEAGAPRRRIQWQPIISLKR